MPRLRTLWLLLILLAGRAGMAAQNPTTPGVWWGYWHSDLGLQPANQLADGTHCAAVRITGSTTQLLGSTLHGVRFYITDKTAVQRAWVWLSASTFALPDGQPDKLVVEVPLEELKDMDHDQQPTELLLDGEATTLLSNMRYASVYAGFTLQLAGTAQHPCRVMSAGSMAGTPATACYYDWYDQHAEYGPLALQLLVSGQGLAPQGVSVQPLGIGPLLAGADHSVDISLANDGGTPVSSVDGEVRLDGQLLTTFHHEPAEPLDELGRSYTLPITLSLPAAASDYLCQVEVMRVNGEPNGSATPQDSCQLTALSQLPLKRSVMEELTGTWCPNCPRGLVGMHLLDSIFTHRFIGIAIHGGTSTEPMRVANYDGSSFVRSLSQHLGGRPSCAVDRLVECDPYGGLGSIYSFGAHQVVEQALSQPTVADIDLSAQWSGQNIDIDVATTFRYASTRPCPYRLMLVVTADSLQGEGDDWLQVNTLVGRTDYDSYVDEFVNGQRRMALKYNHVAIWALGVDEGISGSIALPLVADAPQHFLHTVDMSANALVQRPECLHAIALLLHTPTGQVVNAASCPVAGAETQVSHPMATPHPTPAATCHTLSGQAAAPGHRGLLIERQPDGSVRKTIRH